MLMKRFSFDRNVIIKVICKIFTLAAIYFSLSIFNISEGQTLSEKSAGGREQTSRVGSMGIDFGIIGQYPKWSKVEIELPGPNMSSSGNPNPFLIEVDVTFNGPKGKTYVVPAFYDGDGQGGPNGNVWKVRFSPDSIGDWSFTSVSPTAALDGHIGTFDVISPTNCELYKPGTLPNFFCVGRLQHVGDHYLKFADGPYWLKGGVDDPENFIGEAFGNWDDKKAAIDYLSSKGVNSVYLITNNIDGDRNDVWPWLGTTPEQAKSNSDRFDIAKLLAWEDFFTYVQAKGITLHIILTDDSAWSDFDHELYYRELIARFGHHPALIWNIGEEANEIYSDDVQEMIAEGIRNLDPFGHPITVHRKTPWPFLVKETFDLTSIQMGDGADDFMTADVDHYYETSVDHWNDTDSSDKVIPIMIDETPRVIDVNEPSRLKMRSQILYPLFMGGSNYEMHFLDAYGQGNNGVTIQDISPLLNDMRLARRFIERLPLQAVEPNNGLLSNQDGNYCLAKPGTEYAIYLTEGGSIDVDLSDASENLHVWWYDPRIGIYVPAGTVNGGGIRTFVAPSNEDWGLVISINDEVEPIYFFHLPIILKG